MTDQIKPDERALSWQAWVCYALAIGFFLLALVRMVLSKDGDTQQLLGLAWLILAKQYK